MISLVLSTIAFFVASYFIKRYLDDNDIPKGMTRSLLIFCVAALISYGVALVADHFSQSDGGLNSSVKTKG